MQKNISRAERDNDLIYHQDVPPASALPLIPGILLRLYLLAAEYDVLEQEDVVLAIHIRLGDHEDFVEKQLPEV